MKPSIQVRLTAIARRMANRYGVSAATYAGAESFDVLCERASAAKPERNGVIWVKNAMADVYLSPASVARKIRHGISAAWNAQ